ncbi:MAG: hypothetical protein M3N28_04875 [Actinomycetota bacterium]|nr:hypothetical protein [Actinomycetota bacterium]
MLNPGYVNERIAGLSVEDKEAIADALELILEEPYDPPGLTVHRQRGRGDEEVYIAHLPDNWYLSYTVHPWGLPPLGGKFVRARALLRREI